MSQRCRSWRRPARVEDSRAAKGGARSEKAAAACCCAHRLAVGARGAREDRRRVHAPPLNRTGAGRAPGSRRRRRRRQRRRRRRRRRRQRVARAARHGGDTTTLMCSIGDACRACRASVGLRPQGLGGQGARCLAVALDQGRGARVLAERAVRREWVGRRVHLHLDGACNGHPTLRYITLHYITLYYITLWPSSSGRCVSRSWSAGDLLLPLASRLSPLVSRLSSLASRLSPLDAILSALSSRRLPRVSRLSPLASRL